MASRAMGLRKIVADKGISSFQILSLSDWFQMVGPDTTVVSAEMVEGSEKSTSRHV